MTEDLRQTAEMRHIQEATDMDPEKKRARQYDDTTKHATSTVNRLLLRDPSGNAKHSLTGYQQRVFEGLRALVADTEGHIWNPAKEFDIVVHAFMAERAARR
jgi:hypothetical protein